MQKYSREECGAGGDDENDDNDNDDDVEACGWTRGQPYLMKIRREARTIHCTGQYFAVKWSDYDYKQKMMFLAEIAENA